MFDGWMTYQRDSLIQVVPVASIEPHRDILCWCSPALEAHVQEDEMTVVWLITHNDLEREISGGLQ